MVSHLLQIGFSNCIIFLLSRFGMISAIDLYYKTFMTRNEVHYVITYYMLSQKFNAQSLTA